MAMCFFEFHACVLVSVPGSGSEVWHRGTEETVDYTLHNGGESGLLRFE